MKKLKIFLFIFVVISFIIPIYFSNYLSINYDKIYNYPAVNDAEVNYKDFDFDNLFIEAPLSGKWEFYYNKWIVSDNEVITEKKDYISLPSSWTSHKINDEYLSKDGYASYRIELKGIEQGTRLTFRYSIINISYRVFMNNTLVASSGTMSKNISENESHLGFDFHDYYEVKNNDIISVVIEVGNNNKGGFSAGPRLATSDFDESFVKYVATFSLLSLGVLISFFIIGILLVFYQNRIKKDYSFLLLLFFLLVHFIFSYDIELFLLMNTNIKTNIELIQNMIISTQVILVMVFIKYLKDYHVINFKKNNCILIYIILLISLLLILYFRYEYIGMIVWHLFISSLFLLSVIIIININNSKFYGVISLLLCYALYCIFYPECLFTIGKSVYGVEGYASVIILLLMIVVLITYGVRIFEMHKKELEYQELLNEYMSIKQKTLRNQINPHFIFNSLNAIKSMYHNELCDGDEAMQVFSKQLRTNVDSLNQDLIPFNKELENVENYVKLENYRFDPKFELLMDIDVEDFLVPVLSLQPIVENSIKHSRCNKENGYIEIKAYSMNELIYIIVSDNGIGFDIDKIDTNKSQGLKNITERFKILLDATVKTESVIGKGTWTTICFKRRVK